MLYRFQAHDYSVNTAPCSDSCTIWTEELASDTDAQALLDTLIANNDDSNISFTYMLA